MLISSKRSFIRCSLFVKLHNVILFIVLLELTFSFRSATAHTLTSDVRCARCDVRSAISFCSVPFGLRPVTIFYRVFCTPHNSMVGTYLWMCYSEKCTGTSHNSQSGTTDHICGKSFAWNFFLLCLVLLCGCRVLQCNSLLCVISVTVSVVCWHVRYLLT